MTPAHLRLAARGLAILLVLCVIGALWLSWRDVALPDVSQIDSAVTDGEPVQEPSDQHVFETTIKGYTYALTRRATHGIAGLVVSQHRGDALLNFYHRIDPGNIKDVCVVWGAVVTNGSYRKLRYTSEEFTCYYSWTGSLTPPFDPTKIANNHLIPADDNIARRIDDIRVGDQILMRGLLVDYRVRSEGREILARRADQADPTRHGQRRLRSPLRDRPVRHQARQPSGGRCVALRLVREPRPLRRARGRLVRQAPDG